MLFLSNGIIKHTHAHATPHNEVVCMGGVNLPCLFILEHLPIFSTLDSVFFTFYILAYVGSDVAHLSVLVKVSKEMNV